jgi:tetratricopeptide (TPR) repeat protein
MANCLKCNAELNPDNNFCTQCGEPVLDAQGYFYRGLAYAKKCEYDRAIADYGESIRLNPNAAVAYNNRGNAYDDKGEYDRAIADWKKVLQIDPNNAGARKNIEILRGKGY